MSEVETIIETEVRETRGSAAARRLRREGKVPGVLYGHKRATVSIALPERELSYVIRTGVRMLDIKVGGEAEKALIKELQYDPISLELLHIDLARVAMDETVVVEVPIDTSGTPKGAADGGVLDLLLKEIEIECLPANIPTEIKVKVSDLGVGESLLVKDLVLPPGVKPSEEVDPEAIVVTLHAPREEAEEEDEIEEAEKAAEPEVISEKEREERTEEAEEAEGDEK
ncbi:MAG: 50S ribosomal protein L25 [Planctomycetes bacterium]|nr:50S ribosomal protein L25 [Planctomycetota bacterium]